jgi:surface antigen
MNKNRICLALISTLLLTSITTARAQNALFLRDSPIAFMDDQDEAILRATIDAVLAAPDGTTTDWMNPATGSHGRVQVLDTGEDFDTTCRHIRMRNEADTRKAGGTYRLCLAKDGRWKFAPNAENPPGSAASKDDDA